MSKLSLYARKRIGNLNFGGENAKLLGKYSVTYVTWPGYLDESHLGVKPELAPSCIGLGFCDPRGKGRGTKLSIQHLNATDEAMEAHDELSALDTNTPRAISHCSISPNCSASAAETWLKVDRYKVLRTC